MSHDVLLLVIVWSKEVESIPPDNAITALAIITPPSICEFAKTTSNREFSSLNPQQFGNSYHLIPHYRSPCKVVECNDGQTLFLIDHTWIDPDHNILPFNSSPIV